MNTSTFQMPRHSALLLLPWLVLLIFGTIMVGSSSVAMAGDYVTRRFVNLCVSIVLLAIVAATPLSFWKEYYRLGWFSSLVLVVLVLIPGLGHEVNGATRWIRLPGFNLQAAIIECQCRGADFFHHIHIMSCNNDGGTQFVQFFKQMH